MSFIVYALIAGLCIGIFAGACRFFPWFAPAAWFILVAFIGSGGIVEVLNRQPPNSPLLGFIPALVLFGLGGVSVAWLKLFPGGKRYAAATFFGACAMTATCYLWSRYQ